MDDSTDAGRSGRSDGRRKLSRPERRGQLIEATIRTLAERGYSGITMSDVARMAGLSHGLVNFHFETKEKLLSATLDHLSNEYRDNWMGEMARAGAGAPEQLEAMLRADFNPALYTPERLAAWGCFWGESQTRPLYQDHCGSNDEEYNRTLEALCQRMNDEAGYDHDPIRAARVLRVTAEGVWLDLMTMTTPYGLDEAWATVRTCLAAFYPRHFSVAAAG